MTISPAEIIHPAGQAFDSLAEPYDEIFTNSLIGRAQREAVWHEVARTFQSGQHILELNCGTGEDALFLSRLGISVFACDASQQMITVARRRRSLEAPASHVRFSVLPTEEIAIARPFGVFDGVFSNFSGLNCVLDIADVARQLSTLIRPGGSALLCFSSRFCLWESLWFLGQGNIGKSVRRWTGHSTVNLGTASVRVNYLTAKRLRRLFAPYFLLRRWTGIGITVPPSYVESLAIRHPGVLNKLRAVDRVVCNWNVFRSIGDHLLLSFERTSS